MIGRVVTGLVSIGRIGEAESTELCGALTRLGSAVATIYPTMSPSLALKLSMICSFSTMH
jgi:hypothetical protein